MDSERGRYAGTGNKDWIAVDIEDRVPRSVHLYVARRGEIRRERRELVQRQAASGHKVVGLRAILIVQ